MRDPIEKLRGLNTFGAVSVNENMNATNMHMVCATKLEIMEIADEIEEAYMKLPVDADGVPIRDGDTVECGTLSVSDHNVYAVARNFWVDTGGFTHKPDLTRHVKPDTVESLLAGFQGETLSAQSEYAGDVIGFDCYLRELRTLIEDYAERIREAVEHD